MDLTLPYWKRIWQMITAKNKHISSKPVVTDLLTEVGNELCTGLVMFQAFTPSEFEPWAKKKKIDTNKVFARFFYRVCKALNLEPSVAWNLLCNFLMYEYYGKVSDIENLARYETNAQRLIENIWIFYTSERMFLLKTMRFILEHYTDKTNEFYEVYAKYVQSKTLTSLRKHLLDELEYLIEEINASHASNCITMKGWVDRNNREQLENVLSLIVILNNEVFPMEDFIRMLKLFIKHDFANSPSYIKNVCISDPGFQHVNSIELGAFLVGLESCWNNSERWKKYEKEIENLIFEIAKVGDHSVLLLTWATLHASLNDPRDVENYNKNYSELPLSAFDSDVFSTLYRVARDASGFNCAGGKMVLSSIFTLYNHVCYNFNDNDFLFIQKDAPELLVELFKEEQLAKQCFDHQEQPIKSIFTFAMKVFPYNFTYLTYFAITLVAHPFYAKKVMGTLCSMSTFAEEYNNRVSNLDSVRINVDYYPIPGNKSIFFPKGTEVIGLKRFGKKFLIFKSSYSYFNILLHQATLLFCHLEQRRDIDEDLLETVIAGYKLICEIFKKCDVGNLKYDEIQTCMNILDKLVNILSQEHFKHIPLMKMFCEIIAAVAVSECHLKLDIYKTAILPKLLKFEIKVEHCFQTDVLNKGVLLNYLMEEEQSDTHDLLCHYIEFLSNAVMKNINHLEVQIPGLIYMLRTVFPNHYEWKYSDTVQKNKITNECLKLILKILTQNRKNIENEYQKLIFDFCLQASLHDDFTVKGYINIFKVTNLNIQLEMEKERNWETGETTLLIEIIKMLFTLVLLLMKYNRYTKKSEENSVFQKQLMYSTVNGTNIIKVVAGYIHHSFDLSVQNLAIRVLKNWAADLPLPLLGPLEWDNYQLQRFFLEKLRDPIESEDLKLGIIDLIGISIQHQPGLTGAFFNVKGQQKQLNLPEKEIENGESVADFMIDYLQNVKKSTEIMRNPLQHAILDVIYKLWDNHKSGLIQDVINLEEFWSILADPIFHNIKLDNKLYGSIFGIFSIELHENREEVSEKFLAVVEKYLDVKQNHLKRWRDYLVLISKPINLNMETDQFNQYIVPCELYLLNSWKSFIMFSIQYAPDFYKNEHIRSLIAETCLDALLSHFSAPDEIRIIRIWSDIYLYCITHWYDTETKYENAENLLVKLTAVLERLINYYIIVDNHCKETLLAATSKSIVILSDFMNKNYGLVDKFLAPLGKILDVEYNNLDIKKFRKIEDENTKVPEQLLNWVLILSIGNNLLTLENIEAHSLWFDSYHFLHRVLSCIGPFIKSGNALPVAKVAVQTLIICIQSPLAKMFLNIPLHSFYDEIVPLTEYVNHANINEKVVSTDQFMERRFTF